MMDTYKVDYNRVFALIRSLLADGKEWVFVSNIDNLGATVDLGEHAYLRPLCILTPFPSPSPSPSLLLLFVYGCVTKPTAILNFAVNNSDTCEFIMEVTNKTRADVKVCPSTPRATSLPPPIMLLRANTTIHRCLPFLSYLGWHPDRLRGQDPAAGAGASAQGQGVLPAARHLICIPFCLQRAANTF